MKTDSVEDSADIRSVGVHEVQRRLTVPVAEKRNPSPIR